MRVSKFKGQNCFSALVDDPITIEQGCSIPEDRIGAFHFSVSVLYNFSAVIPPVLCPTNWKGSHGIGSLVTPVGFSSWGLEGLV